MKGVLTELLNYHDEANRLFLDHLDVLTDAHDEVNRLMDHVINAHVIWLDRMNEKRVRHKPWDRHPKNYRRELHRDLMEESFSMIEKGSLELPFRYQNTKGAYFENTPQQVLFHIVIHVTHHRVQINTLLRQSSQNPAVNDYIFYKRIALDI